MPESKFMKTFKRVVAKNPEAFEALAEYDKTHRLRKISYKSRANFTLDEKLLREFRAYCTENGCNMSKLVEKGIREQMRKKAP